MCSLPYRFLDVSVYFESLPGTFHRICLIYLRKYGRLLNLPSNFTITDQTATEKSIKSIIGTYSLELRDTNVSIKEKVAQSFISKAKAKGLSPEELQSKAQSEEDGIGMLLAKVRSCFVDFYLFISPFAVGWLFREKIDS